MSSFTFESRALVSSVLACLVSAMGIAPALGQQIGTRPDFSSNHTGWVGLFGNTPVFEPVPGTLPPLAGDPAHPFVSNRGGRQPTYPIADLSNPNLKPWVRDQMKKDNDEVLAGKIAFRAGTSCMPAGVPGFMAYGGPNPLYFLQEPKQVWMIFTGNQQVRHVYLDVPHSTNPKHTWYGESVGHYEGSTLFIDTIGLSDKTFLDFYRTPHTEKLHVIERWTMADGGQVMQAVFTVDDPEAFYQPWSAMRRYKRVQREMIEDICAENNQHLFDYNIPVAKIPDF